MEHSAPGDSQAGNAGSKLDRAAEAVDGLRCSIGVEMGKAGIQPALDVRLNLVRSLVARQRVVELAERPLAIAAGRPGRERGRVELDRPVRGADAVVERLQLQLTLGQARPAVRMTLELVGIGLEISLGVLEVLQLSFTRGDVEQDVGVFHGPRISNFVQQFERSPVVRDKGVHHRAQSLGLVIVRVGPAQGFAFRDRLGVVTFLEFLLQRVHVMSQEIARLAPLPGLDTGG